ncbi:Mov34/MPN/PAD-1 family protein [Mucilaginibacter arboris]|uniref:Mov34/MPN/PAD-1 family protein n=1 Tax=Mucilaginibacter arboris TaxID=2682090 RepID=UPI0012F91BB2|nr:Mov34/MPN/PAD-1 family protein [Mucilaginibacter arboris]
MKLKNEEIGLYLEITDGLLNIIKDLGLKHYPKEFGGVLVGYYSIDKKTVNIIDTLLPVSYKSSKIHFERGSEGLKEQLIELFNAEQPLIYLGEWHIHPDARPLPSGTDVEGITEIAKHKDVNITSPILLIVGLTTTEMELGFYVYFKNKIYKYETY